jgi:hypothetical protein
VSKRELDKRLDKIMGQARLKQAGVVPIIDVTKWPEEDRFAFTRALDCRDGASYNALIEKHFGSLPERLSDEIVALVVAEQVLRGNNC